MQIFFANWGDMKLIKFLTATSLFIIAFSSILHAEQPEAMLKRFTSELKQKGSTEVLFNGDFVYWPGIYSSMPEVVKTSQGINSPEATKRYMQGFFENPAAFMEKAMQSQLQNIPPEQRTMIMARMQSLAANMSQQFAEMEQKSRTANYEIGSASITGNRALVPVTTTYADGTSRSDSISLVEIDGKWLLSDMKGIYDDKQLPGKM